MGQEQILRQHFALIPQVTKVTADAVHTVYRVILYLKE